MRTTSPEAIGMSSDRLGNIQTKLQTYVDAQLAPGFITLIARKGEVIHYESCGYRNIENQLPIEKDTIFRIYSMTKPITSVALMMLYEQGKFQLYDPVSKYIPEFGKTKVLKKMGYLGQELVEQESPMTIHQLLTHTSGLTYGFFMDNFVEDLYRNSQFADPTVSLEDTIKQIAEFPLLFQPGARWHYSMAVDISGYLVQLLSGMPFDTFLQEKIFAPLSMVDTGFHVPDNKADRFATLYAHNPEDSSLQLHDDQGVLKRDYSVPTTSPFGGHGLVSTTEDYLKFAQMLLNNGELDGTRIIGRKTLAFMASNHIKSESLPLTIGDWQMSGMGFGLGFGVVTDPAQAGVLSSKGNYGWGGAAATNFWVDPQEELVGIIMTQIMSNLLPFQDDFRVMTYQALID
jgi:CubicO group peptidase (beta-lactamase class C family)